LSTRFNGTFFNEKTGLGPKETPAAFDIVNKKGFLQGYMTEYTLNSLFESDALTGKKFDITSYITKYLNYTVTCGDLAVILPELVDKYGKTTAVTISAELGDDTTSIKLATRDITTQASAKLILTVNGETALSFATSKALGDATLQVSTGTIFGSIDKSDIGTFSDFTTTLGLDE